MSTPILFRIDARGCAIPIKDETAALREGETLHRAFRPRITGDYIDYLQRMAAEGARVTQLCDGDAVLAIAVWRDFLTTYCGRRFEIDDLVTSEAHRSSGYGATLVAALEAEARMRGCEAAMLASATYRKDAHRFYLRQRYLIDSFLFAKAL